MGFFYIDESIHDRGEFILAAIVFCREDPTPQVDRALVAAGLRPGQDEFKSSARMDGDGLRRDLRDQMQEILHTARVRLGVVVTPAKERSILGDRVLDGLEKILRANGLHPDPHCVFFDEGIAFGRRGGAIARFSSLTGCDVHIDQDSREVRGLQLADLTSHTMATMLLDTLGLIRKTIKAGPNSGYDPDMDVELGFAMWGSVRYLFFTQDQPDLSLILDGKVIEGLTLQTADYALHIAETCDPDLRRAALARFGEMYVGCIHSA